MTRRVLFCSTLLFILPALFFVRAETLVPGDFDHSMQITFRGYARPTTLTNFPALIELSEDTGGFRYGEFASANGHDLRFTDSDGVTVIPHEVEKWDHSGVSTVWVLVPELEGSGTDSVRAYWGNSSATNAPASTTNGAVWTENYLAVWHLSGPAANPVDATSNGLDGVNDGLTVQAPGKMADCYAVDTDGDNLLIPHVTNSTFSASLWYFYSSVGNDGWNTILGRQAGNYHHLLINDGSRRVGFYNSGNGNFNDSGVALALNTWHHLAIVVDGTNYKLYLNGERIQDVNTFFDNAAAALRTISTSDGTAQESWGKLDEFRVSAVARSVDWVWATYHNTADNAAFLGWELDPNDFDHRMEITFSGYDKAEALTNFPALVELGAVVSALCASPHGHDLRFTDSDGVTVLDHEIDGWNTHGPSTVWVKVPRLASGASIWAHFGNAFDTTLPSYATDGSVWTEDFRGVWHMGESNAVDATVGGHHGTAVGNVDARGLIGGAQEFPAGENSLSIPASLSGLANSATVMGLARLRSGVGQWQGIITERYAGDGNIEIELYCQYGILTAGFYDGAWHTVADTSAFPLDRWVHVAATYDGHVLRLYRDGILVGVSGDFNRSLPLGSNGWYIGHRHDQVDSWDGFLDEMRLSHTVRSSNWVWACAAMMTAPTPFACYGAITGTGDARYWDTAVGAGLQGGSGIWDTSTTLWSDNSGGSDPLQIWSPGDTAHFTADGPAMVTVTGAVITSGLTIEGREHTFSKGTVVVGGSGVVADRSAVIASEVVLDANQTWTVAAGVELVVHHGLAGDGDLAKDGTGVLSLPDFGASARAVTISNGTVHLTGQTPSFSPPPVSGYTVWLDARDVSGDGSTPTDGSTIDTWANKAVTGTVGDFIGYAAGAPLPTYVESSLSFNGGPVVQFHGNNTLQSILYNTHSFAAPATVLYVSRMTGEANYRLLSAQSGNWLLGYHGNTCDDAFYNGWVYNGAAAVRPDAYLYEAVMPTNGVSSFYRNGELLASSTSATNGPNGLRLGGGIGGKEHSSGEIAELLVYDRALTDEEREAVETYLLGKWRGEDSGGAALVVAEGGTLDLNGCAQTVRSLADGGGTGGIVSNSASRAAVLTVDGGEGTAFSGRLVDGGATVSLKKSGTGTLTLSGANTFTGPVVLNGGTLRLRGGDDRLSANASVELSGTDTLDLGTNAQTLAALGSDRADITIEGRDVLTVNGNHDLRADGTLSMGSLSSFIYNAPGNVLSVGGQVSGIGGDWASGTATLAHTNAITALRLGVADVGRNVSAGSGNSGTMYLGQANVVHADTIQVGANQTYGTLQFRDGLADPTLVVRGTDGGSSRADVTLASNGSNYTQSRGTLDLTVGVNGFSTLDARVGTLLVGRNGYGTTAQGLFRMGGGVLDATRITVAESSGTGGAVGEASLDGGTIKVQTLTLGQQASGAVTSTFTLASGMLLAGTVGPGAGTATRTLNWNEGTIANYDAETDLSIGALSKFSLSTTGLVFDVDGGRNATVDTAVSGSGGFRKRGDGELSLNGSHSFAGNTVVENGYLWGIGVISNSMVSVRDSAVLGPAGSGSLGTLLLANATLDAGARLACLLNGDTPTLDVAGVLATASTNWVDLRFSGPLTNGTYRLIDYTDSIGGDGFSALVLSRSFAGRATAVLANNAADSAVELIVSDVAGPASLLWKGSVDDRWDVDGTANWATIPGGSNSTFMSGDTVRFDDTANRFAVTIADQVAPGALVLDHSVNDYTIGGDAIAGTAGLTKRGTACLTLTGDNTYSGETIIEAGVLQVGDGGGDGSVGTGGVTNDGVLVFNRGGDIEIWNQITGTGVVVQAGGAVLTLSHPTNTFSGGTIVSNGVLVLGHGTALPRNSTVAVAQGATFDFNGMHAGDATRNYRFTVAGAGRFGQGAMVNMGAGVGNYASVAGLVFTSDTTLGGLNRWDIGTGAAGTLFDGGGYRLTKIGPFELCIRPELLSNLASVTIHDGYVKYEGFSRTNSATAGLVNTVEQGGSLGSYGPYTLNMPAVMNGGVLQNHGGGAATWTGDFVLNRDTTINTSGNNGSGYITIAGDISGEGGITKVSPGALYLRGANSYSGPIDIRDGYLVVQSDAALGSSDSDVPVAPGATLQFEGPDVTVSGRTVKMAGTGEDGSRGALCGWSGANRWEGDVELVGDSYIGVHSGTLTIDGPVRGPYTVVKRLAGRLVFAGDTANLYAGTTIVHNAGGFLVLDKPSGVNAIPGDLQVGNNGGGTAWVELGNSNQIPDSAMLTFEAAYGSWSYLKLMGHNETVVGFSGSGGGVLENTENDNGITNGGVLTVVHDEDYVFNGHIRNKSGGDSAGTFGLTKDGSGTLSLGRVNGFNKVGYSGPTTVNGGTLVLSNLYPRVGGDYNLGGTQIHIASNCTVIIDSDAALDRWLQQAALSGSGTLIKEGTGYYQLDYGSPKMFAGRIIIRDGILGSAYDRTDWVGCVADVMVESNGVFDVRVDPVWIDSLDGAGEVHNSYQLGGQQEMPLTVGVANGSGTFSGRIRGTGTLANNTPDAGRIHLVKVGTGTQVLSGINSYAGPTTVDGGTLIVNGIHVGGGAYAINGGGTLGGTGRVDSVVNVVTGGTLSAGQGGPGALILGGLALVPGAALDVDLDEETSGNYDQLVVNGTVDPGNADLHVTLGYTPQRGDTVFIIVNDDTDPIGSAFKDLGDGALLAGSHAGRRHEFVISYQADSTTGQMTGGNDVALRCTVPGMVLIVR